MSRIFVGVMSGTSLDGVDVAIVRFQEGESFPPAYSIDSFTTYPIPSELKGRILNGTTGRLSMREAYRLDRDLGLLYAEAIERTLADSLVERSDVEAVGLHGQTMWHAPALDPVGLTMQIGSASIVAERCGLPVVSDFRTADVAAGGEGAPLVPIFDLLYLSSRDEDRAHLNVGGISNVTWRPRSDRSSHQSTTAEDVLAFDTGPGNLLVDTAMTILYDRPYDNNGEVARSGTVDRKALERLLNDPWLQLAPPKSTGRERYGYDLGRGFVGACEIEGVSPEDIVATLVEFTARTVVEAIDRFCLPEGSDPYQVVVGGGGARNGYLLERLSHLGGERASVIRADDIGVPADAKEAICFALLALLRLDGRPGNLPSVTGASGPRVLGTIRDPFVRS